MAKLKTTRTQLPTQSIHRFTAIATASAIVTLMTTSTSFAINGGNGGGDSSNYPRNVNPMLSDSPEPGPNAADSAETDPNLQHAFTTGYRSQGTEVTRDQKELTNNNTQTGDSNSGTSNGTPGNQNPSRDKTAANNKNRKPGDGQCTASEILNKTCQQTYDWIENAKLTDTISQVGGSAVVGATNQVGAMKAQTAGTQSAVMSAAANSQEKAGALQTALGIGNTAMGAYQIMLSRQHKQIGETDLKNDLNQSQIGASSTGDPATIQKAINEQKAVERAAMMAGVKSVITGVTQTLSGALAIGAAKQAKDLAGKLSDVTGNNYQLTSTNPDTGTTTPSSTTALSTGTASDPAVAATDPNSSSGDVPKIDTPTNPDATDGGPGAGPVAGTFQPGATKGAGGGGSGGGIGVGSMSPAKAEPEQTGPRMADSRSNTAYSQGGGSGYAGAGGGVSADKSADLGFLANLLPKPQDEMGKNGILDYGTAGRSPASMAPYSFLGKDVNIFQRISDRTTTKLKSGDVGSIGGS